jgi:glycosyltransferase involved in cell wall biosynthesis
VVIEAMACRKPVVATKVGGIPEIVEDGKNGILVEANNPNALTKAILSVLKDENLRKSLATNGYMRVSSKFRCEHTGSKYENLFSKLLGGVES